MSLTFFLYQHKDKEKASWTMQLMDGTRLYHGEDGMYPHDDVVVRINSDESKAEVIFDLDAQEDMNPGRMDDAYFCTKCGQRYTNRWEECLICGHMLVPRCCATCNNCSTDEVCNHFGRPVADVITPNPCTCWEALSQIDGDVIQELIEECCDAVRVAE